VKELVSDMKPHLSVGDKVSHNGIAYIIQQVINPETGEYILAIEGNYDFKLPIDVDITKDVFIPLMTFGDDVFQYTNRLLLNSFKGYQFHSEEKFFTAFTSDKSANLLFVSQNHDETTGLVFLQLPNGSDYKTWTPRDPGNARGFELTLVGEDGETSLNYKDKFEYYGVDTGTVLLRFYNSPKDENRNPVGVFAIQPTGYVVSPQTIEYDRRIKALEEKIKELESKLKR